MIKELLNTWIPFEDCGCWYRVELSKKGEPYLLYAAMLTDGGIDLDDNKEINYGEESDFFERDVLRVNKIFGTSFEANVEE